MSQAKRSPKKPLLNRKQTETLLKTLKVTTVAGTLSLTMAGWSWLAEADAGSAAQAASNQSPAIAASQPAVAPTSAAVIRRPTATPVPTPTPSTTSSGASQASTQQQVVHLNIVSWVQDVSGNPVAVVRDSRGNLWYVMGSDVPRIEQGLSPQYQPQPVRQVTRTRAS
jgi:hypothetical protein